MKESYIKKMRQLVGNEYLMLNATAVVIVNENNEVLLQKRTDNNLWGLPGGLLELRESISLGALREVKEETNLDVKLTKFIGIFNNPFMRWREHDCAQVTSFAFLAEIIGGELKVNDHESTELAYFSYEMLPSLHSMDTIQIIDAYYKNKFNQIEGESYDG
ncbi:MAG: NUDIX domain-containing protein [Candidatus Izemoplasmatales bacterium]